MLDPMHLCIGKSNKRAASSLSELGDHSCFLPTHGEGCTTGDTSFPVEWKRSETYAEIADVTGSWSFLVILSRTCFTFLLSESSFSRFL